MTFICSSLERTGPTNQLLNIIRNNKNISFLIVTLSDEKSNSMVDEFIGIGNIILSLKKDVSFFKQMTLIYNSKIIHSQGIKADFLSSIFFWKKNISTLRNYPFEDYPLLYGNIKGTLMAYFHLFILRFISYRVTISESTAIKNNKKSNLNFDVIYNGVDTEKFKSKNDGEQLKLKLGIDDNDIVYIYTGPLIKRKNVSKVISIINGCKNSKLLILGDGNEKDHLIQNSEENIIFVGNVNNVEDYLNISNVFILLSSSEGFPNAVLEALSVGIPCILSDIPSHRDVKKIMKEDVFIYNDSDMKLFLNRNILSLRKEHIRERAILKLSSLRMAEQYLKLYKSI